MKTRNGTPKKLVFESKNKSTVFNMRTSEQFNTVFEKILLKHKDVSKAQIVEQLVFNYAKSIGIKID